jgi:hypothetical protein
VLRPVQAQALILRQDLLIHPHTLLPHCPHQVRQTLRLLILPRSPLKNRHDVLPLAQQRNLLTGQQTSQQRSRL